MKTTPWPFKKCASPSAFLKALRASIPHRFKTWKTTWWIDRARDVLVFTITASYASSRRAFPLSIGDVLSRDVHTSEATNPRLRRFAGYDQLHMSSGGSHGDNVYQGVFRVHLAHLPLVQKTVARQTALRNALAVHIEHDPQLQRLRLRLDRLRNAISDRIEQARQEYHAKHSAEEARIESALGDERG